MESSEDDAGAATNASRRVSARERDIGGGEDNGTTSSMVEEAKAACEGASSSEEAFDADSVPSPSAQDVNTSTEAILDMIDEIVDGPDATRRRSYASPDAHIEGICIAPSGTTHSEPLPTSKFDPQVSSSPKSAFLAITENESVSKDHVSDTLQLESAPQSIAPTSDVYVENVSLESVNNADECTTAVSTGVSLADVPPESSSMSSEAADCNKLVSEVTPLIVECLPDQKVLISASDSTENEPKGIVSEEQSNELNIVKVSSQGTEILSQKTSELESSRKLDSPQASSSVANSEAAQSTSKEPSTVSIPETLSNLSPSVPSSSVVETVKNISDSSENQVSERTIKCVTSSDTKDNVTVESAESTSSEIIRLEQATANEPVVRSPLRRRLVRPASSDRRPDSTVSSSVDLRDIHVHTTHQITSESVTKDVSSSSDAVTSVYCNIKPEEIRNVSEISVCKAETSMNPPKKIKLVRQKIGPSMTDNTPEKSIPSESEQCQSTSSECVPSAQDIGSTSSIAPTVECIDKTPSISNDMTSDTVTDLPQMLVGMTVEKSEECNVIPKESDSLSVLPVSKESQELSNDDEEKKVPPIKLNLNTAVDTSSHSQSESQEQFDTCCIDIQDTSDSTKQVPKLTIKLGSKQTEESKSLIPKLTIKPIRPPSENEHSKKDAMDQIPTITKLNIKPIPKPAEKINDFHRKSSSSEISESESSENDESNSMSDPTSNSDQGADIVPKVTIKVGKPGTESEGKFYTEQNVPKILIKGIQSNENEEHESTSKLKLVISHPEEKQLEKIPKLTIKTVSKAEGQPLSPKLTIKPLKPPDIKIDCSADLTANPSIPKMKITAESLSSGVEAKENTHIPKITIKPVVKSDMDTTPKTPKKSTVLCDSPEHIPVVTKLNIKPILKPMDGESIDNLEERVPVVSKLNIKPVLKPIDSGETSEDSGGHIPVVSKLNIKPIVKPTVSNDKIDTDIDIPVVAKLNIRPILKTSECGKSSESIEEKVPVVSKLNIKPIIKPKESEVESSVEDLPKVTKLNIKPLRNPEEKSSEEKDCDLRNADKDENSIPVVTKINIKPIIKPVDEDASKDSENQSSETGNSSDDNTENIPVVTKINIKPILKPNEQEQESTTNVPSEEGIPIVTKLNIKPLIKPDECKSPSSPKRDSLKITKLNIKPVVKPEETDQLKAKDESEDSFTKNPPLVMKINIKNVGDVATNEGVSTDDKKVNSIDNNTTHLINSVEDNIPKVTKINIKPIVEHSIEKSKEISADTAPVVMNCTQIILQQPQQNEISKQNCVPDLIEDSTSDKNVEESKCTSLEKNYIGEPVLLQNKIQSSSYHITKSVSTREIHITDNTKFGDPYRNTAVETVVKQTNKPQSVLQNCTLLKKLLETKKDGLDKRLEDSRTNHLQSSESYPPTEVINSEQHNKARMNSEIHENEERKDLSQTKINDVSEIVAVKDSSAQETPESLTKPLEISVSDKIMCQSSGQDSPRIILKINKTDHGPSAKIITEERPSTPQQNDVSENILEIVNDKLSQKKVLNSRKKTLTETPNVPMGKRLRSSRIVEEKSPTAKKNVGKRPSSTETSPVQSKEPELSVLESKRLKLGQLLSNKSLTITPVPIKAAPEIPKKPSLDTKQTTVKTVNHSLLNNENCSKNGNSKLHNILSNLQAKQAQALAFNELKRTEKLSTTPDLESNASTGSSDVVEVIVPIENSHPDVMIINDNSESRDFGTPAEDALQDPLEGAVTKPISPVPISPVPVSPVPLTPQPKKRGRPRKLPLSEGAKPAPVTLPVPALEERPQRSLRLSRDRPTPTILVKPRGRGRGRGARRAEVVAPREEAVVESANKLFAEQQPVADIDPTSSRIKLPRMTEALDKLPTCTTATTPLSTRRRSSSASTESKLFEPEPKVVLNILPKLEEALKSSPETPSGRGSRGGRGRRGGRGQTPGRTPRGGRGRGRGGGRGAQYMKETMGIYGRVCGPATTTVQLFEEETCMMDDNATSAKSTHFIDEDSQSSVMSSTNDSSRMRKSKFADLFDSNKVWTAADVKEYEWPPPEVADVEHQVMMIQEQVAMFLGVKSFKRRYPELKRRAVAAEERDYVLSKGLVTEALCDLGITAVDASEVLDIMLSDYPHKYEEYRQHQRHRDKQMAEASATVEEPAEDSKPEQKAERIELKPEPKVETKPEPPKVDLEKTRQEAMAAAIASASEWNARLSASRAHACVDLQTHTVHRRRAPPAAPLPAPPAAPPAPPPAPRAHCRPPAGFYPHALLPGQYQHHYRTYTPQQLRYFPLNTVVEGPPPAASPPPSEWESEREWGGSSSSADDSDSNRPSANKRKKLTKTKRSSQAEASSSKEEAKEREREREKEREREDPAELCRVCKLRLEANRKYTHERFLVCAQCNAKLHPGCVELSADTVRKAREYAWQCAQCKTCAACLQPRDLRDMLFCDLCDRGYHAHCLQRDKPPQGRWHCAECAVCKSCGARSPGGPPPAGGGGGGGGGGGAGGEEPTWHHHTKRGPGGHKVYSHSLCTPCARAYRIGRYCPLCERSFIGPKGTMQLVICKLCDRQHHQECVKQLVSALNVLDYTCGECRRGGITSRSAAARLAPRTIATLFMAKRRFNKYAHRQYMKSRLAQARAADPPLVAPDDASDASDAAGDAEPADPLEGVGDGDTPLTMDAPEVSDAPDTADAPDVSDETAAAVAALRMDFGD